MGFLKKLAKSLFGSGGGRPSPLLDFYVRCDSCGEVIHGQINLHNDLSVQYEGDDQFYFCRKGLVGGGSHPALGSGERTGSSFHTGAVER